ncbi:tripartite motif-containing protein 45-like [Stylophora pistillata]|uniref:tripartite motif-containing protein 45-like n=1 Tax=Stylophora pistillata TaxID=50429 RepID=UPI000C0398D2|nr:tripartite motif-containing protein 45-like [Stylophora pistillata]
MEALLENLVEHVICPICSDTYTDPKTIACLHTFCCECLKKHALATQKQGRYRCPECQTDLDIPEGSRFTDLPSSFQHKNLLSLLAVRINSEGSAVDCSICRKHSAETSYCFDCQKFMCCDCVKAHELFRTTAFQGHKVTLLKQFITEDYEALLKRPLFCSQKQHEREVLKFYCFQCQSCICQICNDTDHRSHDVVPLDEAADAEKAKIMSEVEAMKKKRETYTEILRQMETNKQDLECSLAAAKHQVSQAAEKMIARVRALESEAITSLENTRASRIEKLSSARESAKSLLRQINQTVEFGNDLQQRRPTSDVEQSKKYLEERLKELSETQVPTVSVSPFVQFVPTWSPESLNLGFATINIDGNESTLDGQSFRAGEEGAISICPKLHKDEFRNKKQKVQAEVRMEPADQIASLKIYQEENGTFQVKFVANVPGIYIVEVMINGEPLDQNPLNVQVMEAGKTS